MRSEGGNFSERYKSMPREKDPPLKVLFSGLSGNLL